MQYESDEKPSESGSRTPLEGWLLLYVEFTIVVIVWRLLAAYFVYDGEIGFLSLMTDYKVYMGLTALQTALAIAALLGVVLRKRIAARLVVLNEAAAIGAAAVNVLAFTAQGEDWLIAAAQVVVSVCWIAYFLRSSRVRRTFAAASDAV